jgi:hypothetical protein
MSDENAGARPQWLSLLPIFRILTSHSNSVHH